MEQLLNPTNIVNIVVLLGLIAVSAFIMYKTNTGMNYFSSQNFRTTRTRNGDNLTVKGTCWKWSCKNNLAPGMLETLAPEFCSSSSANRTICQTKDAEYPVYDAFVAPLLDEATASDLVKIDALTGCYIDNNNTNYSATCDVDTDPNKNLCGYITRRHAKFVDPETKDIIYSYNCNSVVRPGDPLTSSHPYKSADDFFNKMVFSLGVKK